MGGEGVLVLQDVGTMKSLHCRCEMCFDCVERKRRAKLPASATAPRVFAAALSFQACLRVFHMYILYVCVHKCVCVYVCGHVYMNIIKKKTREFQTQLLHYFSKSDNKSNHHHHMHVCMYLYIYAFIHMCMCMCMHICA